MKNPRDIIFAPVVSEKSYSLNENGKYAFFVDPKANKTEIRIAIEKIFGVKVKSVNTMNRSGKQLRNRFGFGKQKNTKRAIISLSQGTIDIFAGQQID